MINNSILRVSSLFQKRSEPDKIPAPAQKDFLPMSPLTSQEALRLTASFSFAADRMRTADQSQRIRASFYETASRVAFLRAQSIAKQEQLFPVLGESYRRTVFSVA